MDEATTTLLSRIEDASLNASAPPQQRWIDGWIVRYGPGKARRARCVNAVANGRLPLARKIELAAEVFREAALPMVVRVTAYTQPPSLDAELAALGWPVAGPTRVRFKTGLDASALPQLPPGTHWLALDAAGYAERIGALRASPVEQRIGHAERLLASPVPYRGYAIAHDSDGAVLSCGQYAREGELVGLYDVHTTESARGSGLAGILCQRLLALAAAEGARVGYLQVEADNTAALRVYDRLGFVDGYGYHYREAPAR